MLYDKQRLAVMQQTNQNEKEFDERNMFMARATMEANLQNDADRKNRENDNKMSD